MLTDLTSPHWTLLRPPPQKMWWEAFPLWSKKGRSLYATESPGNSIVLTFETSIKHIYLTVLNIIFIFCDISIYGHFRAKFHRSPRVVWRGYPTFCALSEYAKKIFLIFRALTSFTSMPSGQKWGKIHILVERKKLSTPFTLPYRNDVISRKSY